LHTHSSQGSACSRMFVEDLVQAAVEKSLDGVCITDHDYWWDPRELAKLERESGIKVYGGVELSTSLGDILVYGVHQSLLNLRNNLPKLVQHVAELGGVMIAAHPLRGDFALSTLSREERGLDPVDLEAISRRPLFRFVHTFEVFNGRSSWQEIQAAVRVAALMEKRGVGGSDAHSKLSIGSCVTIFEETVQNEAHLVAQLLQGRFQGKKKEESKNVLGMR
jgi:predicted metal-dependent phosphoesterase TrpH